MLASVPLFFVFTLLNALISAAMAAVSTLIVTPCVHLISRLVAKKDIEALESCTLATQYSWIRHSLADVLAGEGSSLDTCYVTNEEQQWICLAVGRGAEQMRRELGWMSMDRLFFNTDGRPHVSRAVVNLRPGATAESACFVPQRPAAG